MRRHLLLPLSCLLAAATPAQMLLTTDATSDAVVAFDPFNGALLFSSLFPIPNTVQVAAIDVNGEIWISEQTGDRITRRDLTGNILGVIGPTFPGGGLDNIRGMAFVGGQVYVTNAGTANGAPGNAIVVFDAAGNFVQSFATTNLATSPFAVLEFQGDILVSGFSNNKDIYRFTLGGVPVGIFHDSTTINPAHGLARAADGNVWCIGFTSQNACKLDATTGAVLQSFAAPSTPRGIYELGNGNVMWTNGTGVHIWNPATGTSTQVFAGNCYHLNLYGASGTASATQYGIGCDGLFLGTAGLPQLGNSTFALLVANVPAVSPIAFVAFGSAQILPGIDLAGIGMAGCFGLTTFDLGLYTGGPVASGVSTMPLPIPNVGALSGATFAVQGASFSLATALGLASSNGVWLVLGN
jgi:sugar lactone lactonase YvrE